MNSRLNISHLAKHEAHAQIMNDNSEVNFKIKQEKILSRCEFSLTHSHTLTQLPNSYKTCFKRSYDKLGFLQQGFI